MKKHSCLIQVVLLAAFLEPVFLFSQEKPRLVMGGSTSYQTGEMADESIWLLDQQLNRVHLGELIRTETEVAVLILFGGAAAQFPESRSYRGPLWCEDSFDDLSVQRALVNYFKKDPRVQFIPVAIPPVYGASRFGFAEDVFLSEADNSPEYRQAVERFISHTEAAKTGSLLPFEEIYYDPKNRLAQNRGQRQLDETFGEIYPWQGKFKWHLDPRKYGTPTIWLLGGNLEILQDPFVGNDYDSGPPEIYYNFTDLKQAIEKHLQ